MIAWSVFWRLAHHVNVRLDYDRARNVVAALVAPVTVQPVLGLDAVLADLEPVAVSEVFSNGSLKETLALSFMSEKQRLQTDASSVEHVLANVLPMRFMTVSR